MSSEKLLTVLQCWPSQVCVDPLKMSFHLTQWQLWSSGLLFSLVTKSIFSSNKHDRKKCGPRLIICKDFITYLKCHVLLHWKLRAKAKISTLTQDLSRLNKHHAGGRKGFSHCCHSGRWHCHQDQTDNTFLSCCCVKASGWTSHFYILLIISCLMKNFDLISAASGMWACILGTTAELRVSGLA